MIASHGFGLPRSGSLSVFGYGSIRDIVHEIIYGHLDLQMTQHGVLLIQRQLNSLLALRANATSPLEVNRTHVGSGSIHRQAETEVNLGRT
jgi:hypothetical protein